MTGIPRTVKLCCIAIVAVCIVLSACGADETGPLTSAELEYIAAMRSDISDAAETWQLLADVGSTYPASTPDKEQAVNDAASACDTLTSEWSEKDAPSQRLNDLGDLWRQGLEHLSAATTAVVSKTDPNDSVANERIVSELNAANTKLDSAYDEIGRVEAEAGE